MGHFVAESDRIDSNGAHFVSHRNFRLIIYSQYDIEALVGHLGVSRYHYDMGPESRPRFHLEHVRSCHGHRRGRRRCRLALALLGAKEKIEDTQKKV